MALDPQRGLVYIPTGSAAFDFYGVDRHGDDLFANTLLCLDAATSQRKWHFQAIHHDIWDLDFPSPPTLGTVQHEGKPVDAVIVAGKSGFLYVLNRETGESLFPLEERPIPPSTVDGKQLARTEPVPTRPAPFVRQHLDQSMVTNRTPAAHAAVLEKMHHLNYGDLFLPPSFQGTVFFPGLAGGAEWGGSAYDPQTHLYYVNANELGWVVRLVPSQSVQRTKDQAGSTKRRVRVAMAPIGRAPRPNTRRSTNPKSSRRFVSPPCCTREAGACHPLLLSASRLSRQFRIGFSRMTITRSLSIFPGPATA